MKGKNLPIVLIVVLALVGGIVFYYMYQPSAYNYPAATETPAPTPTPTQTTGTTAQEQPKATQTTGTTETSALTITVVPDAASYKAGEKVNIAGKTMPNASVTLQIHNHLGSLQRTRLLTPDAEGNYLDSFSFTSKATKGTYTVTVTASKTGYADATATAKFDLLAA